MLTDKKSLDLINKAHPAIREALKLAMEECCLKTPKGVHPTFTETIRSYERSDALYNQPFDGKDNDGDGKIDEADEKVTNAKGGSSWHNFGLAADFVLIINGKTSWIVDKNWLLCISIFEKYGFKSGIHFKSMKGGDAPHIEKTFGLSLSTARIRYANKDFIAGTNFIRI